MKNSLLKEIVENILYEENEENKDNKEKPKPKPKKKSSKIDIEASTGSGKFSAGVQEAGALSKDDPKQLMKNLNISSVMGSNDVDKVKSMLQQAISGTKEMKAVYNSLSIITKAGKEGLEVKVSDAQYLRDGVKYLYHTVVGAKNAGKFSPTESLQIEKNSGRIIIYSGKKNSWDS